jgi:D-glycero-D-manno-heptose 1,7-bisphosphate phosphatase
MTMRAAAAFLDRDGTINLDSGYVRAPEQVRLLDGAGTAIGRLNRAGVRVIVVSNQSGLARGMLDERTLGRIHERLRELLAGHHARLDAVYVCPHLQVAQGATVTRYAAACDCRKPLAGMLHRAASDWGLDLSACWMVGDSPTDVAAGRRAGCRTIQIGEQGCEAADRLAKDLSNAVDTILSEAG